ncbi:hypothetical protein [Motilibacter deserti]|uniref:Uncharacterized protein n=1 Tax=Motilibacter deserti TaxID=2714956 RepID=A0ABX0H2Q4_9ACTN|nr:hypothetical protein [Motilibacter deserti]NHC16141.1 hypothetical protein [Motilibacter deserti]
MTDERATVPRWPFHAALALPTAALLWAESFPGRPALWWTLGVLGLALGALTWLARLGLSRARRDPWSWWFVVGPVAGALVLAFVAVDGPLRVRWALGEDRFRDAAQRVLDTGNGEPTPLRLGTYTITSLEPVPGGVLMDEVTGTPGGRAGFAYLPDGGLERLAAEGYLTLAESRGLGGGWYAWAEEG